MSIILEVTDLHVRYGKVEALHGASLKVGAGQIVTVIGPNGAGKSTMLGAIMGALPISRSANGVVSTSATTWPACRWKSAWRAACAWCPRSANCLPP